MRAVHEQTEGNPFFLGEVVRLLAAEGTLEEASTATLAIPQGVRDVVGRRLDRLSAQANEALARRQPRSGATSTPELLARVAGTDAASVDAALEYAVAAQLLGPSAAGGRYRFSHALVRETLYEELSAAQRPALHRAHRRGPGGRSTAPTRTACSAGWPSSRTTTWRAARAGDAEKAVDYAIRAGERAISPARLRGGSRALRAGPGGPRALQQDPTSAAAPSC